MFGLFWTIIPSTTIDVVGVTPKCQKENPMSAPLIHNFFFGVESSLSFPNVWFLVNVLIYSAKMKICTRAGTHDSQHSESQRSSVQTAWLGWEFSTGCRNLVVTQKPGLGKTRTFSTFLWVSTTLPLASVLGWWPLHTWEKDCRQKSKVSVQDWSWTSTFCVPSSWA